jgi:hypothetical protein
MENIGEKTQTELLILINSLNKKHEKLRTEVISHSKEIDVLETIINNKIVLITNIESDYVKLIEEMNKKGNKNVH